MSVKSCKCYILHLVNTPPQAGLKISSIDSLLVMLSNDFLGNPLVKMSADCSVVGIYVIQICPLSIFSLMKCLSTSICLVLSCRTGLCAIDIADLLSQYSFIGGELWTFNSCRSFFTHNVSQIPWASALNSASALLLATTLCFLLQLTKFPPTKVQ